MSLRCELTVTTSSGGPRIEAVRTETLNAGVKWGHWTLPVVVGLGLIALIGVTVLSHAMQQFACAEWRWGPARGSVS